MTRDDAEPALLWPVGEAAQLCAPNEVQVWCWSLHGEEAQAEELRGELSAEEQARAERFAFRRDWRRYVLAHAGMRRVLAGCLGMGGNEIVLGQGEHGKPIVMGDETFGFNLTHSENVAVLAVARGAEVGVDVESMRMAPHPVGQLSTKEQEYLNGLPEEALGMAFYRCWTRKEALLKGVGVGLLGDLGEFTVLPEWDRAVISPNAGAGVATLMGWRVRELAPAAGYTGCLALPRADFAVRCLRLGETS